MQRRRVRRYKDTYKKDPADIQAAFCTGDVVVPPPPPPKAKKEKKEKKPTPSKAEQGQADAKMPQMDELLKKYDTDGSISNLIEMERESPELMLEPAELAQVQAGSKQIRCDVCGAATTVALRRAKKRRARDEEALSRLVTELCVGTPEGSSEYPKYPGNPPLWGEMYSVGKAESGRWTMKKLKKGAPKEEENGAADYNHFVMKHSMISRACKEIVHEHPELDLAEYMFSHARATPAEISAGYCEEFCAEGGGKDEL